MNFWSEGFWAVSFWSEGFWGDTALPVVGKRFGRRVYICERRVTLYIE